MDVLSKTAEGDPQSAAISSAYVAAANNYIRTDLKFGQDLKYRPWVRGADDFQWDSSHKQPG
jgi:hypothetical protein